MSVVSSHETRAMSTFYMLRHVSRGPGYREKIYADAARLRDGGATRKEVQKRVVRTWSPPYWPAEVQAIVEESFNVK